MINFKPSETQAVIQHLPLFFVLFDFKVFVCIARIYIERAIKTTLTGIRQFPRGQTINAIIKSQNKKKHREMIEDIIKQ